MTRRAITIDLVTVSRFAVGGAEIALPQRVALDLDAHAADSPTKPRATAQGVLSDGTEAFEASLAGAEDADRKVFRRLLRWADELAALPGVRLYTYRGKNGDRFTLLPRFTTEKAGLVTIWNDNGKPYLSLLAVSIREAGAKRDRQGRRDQRQGDREGEFRHGHHPRTTQCPDRRLPGGDCELVRTSSGGTATRRTTATRCSSTESVTTPIATESVKR